MSAFNRRLSPHRVLGLPLGAAAAGLVTTTATLLSVVLPGWLRWVLLAVAVAAVPVGMAAALAGDDIVFVRVVTVARREARAAAWEALWL